MKQVLVAVLVALAFLQPVRAHAEAQETEENHSTNRGRDQSTVLNLDHYLLQLNNKLDTLNSKLNAFDTVLSQHKQQTAAKLEAIDASLSQHKQQTSLELAQLQTSLNTTQSSLEQLGTILSQHKQETSVQLDELQDIPTATTAQSTDQPSVHTCGGTGGWRRVVYLDMTDPSTTCPSGWNITGYSKRTCGRATDGRLTCDSVTFPVSGGQYSRVCGRIKAYQWGSTVAFFSYHNRHVATINGAYVDGISVTHSRPRQHIWTFAAGSTENRPAYSGVCPCDGYFIRVPPFVGNNYFCESGVNEPFDDSRHFTFHSDDPLWDGQNCLSRSTCCSRNNPPYFVKQLPTPTTDDIEARICLYYLKQYRDVAVELVELYVQ